MIVVLPRIVSPGEAASPLANRQPEDVSRGAQLRARKERPNFAMKSCGEQSGEQRSER